MTDFEKVLLEIENLEHFQTINCPNCGEKVRFHCLEIYAECPKCKTEQKVRAFGAIGTEIQDVIDAVLIWTGNGENLEAVLKRHSVIQNEIEMRKGL